jgi:hypothetical protein
VAAYTPNVELYLPNNADTGIEVAESLADNFTKIDTALKESNDLATVSSAKTDDLSLRVDEIVLTGTDPEVWKVPNKQTWTAVEGQTDFTILNGKIPSANYISVFVGGVPQDEIELVTSATFRLSGGVPEGVEVYAEWFETKIPVGQVHAVVHEKGGQDELDITKLKNYQELVSTPITEVSSSLADIAINVKSEGAKGDGVTDDTTAIQAIIDSMTTGGTIFFPKGTYKITNLSILNPYITLKGEGTIYNGNITIGKNIINEPYREYFTVIEGLRFDRESLSDTIDAVEMQRAQRIRVTNCKFNNYNSCLAVKQVDLFDPPEPQGPNQAHVMRAQIDNCMIHKTNHVLRVYKLLSAGVMSSGDIQVFDNTAYCFKRHIYAEGLDGLICSGNTFLFPDNLNVAENANKLENIFIDKGAEIIISDNNLFEAGADSVLLSGIQFFTITGNNIAFPSQRIKGDGIRIINGDPAGEEYSVGTIVGNHIIFPTKGGIGVENNSSHISIVGNVIRDAGNESRYYGAVQTVTPYGIKIASTSKYVSEFGNVCSGGTTPIINDSQFGFSTVKEQNGKTGNLALTTSFASLGTITYPKSFDKIPTVQIMLDGISSAGNVTIVPTNVTETGFTISGFGSIANTITVSWRAIV